MRRMAVHLGGIAALLSTLAACEPAGSPDEAPADLPPPVAFDSGTARLETETDTVVLGVEIAETAEQRTHGLMERTLLPADAGMIFLYKDAQPASAGFWMFRTRIPLDIAFLDEDGRIVAIRQMEPCTSPYARACPVYSPGVGYTAALEVNRGTFAAHGVEVGDRVVLERPGA